MYKIASFEMTFDDLLIEIGRTGKPVIMSTGMANLLEVNHAIQVLVRHGAGEIILLHCVSAYPTPLDQVNLKALDALREHFGQMVGFSDHTMGSRAAIAAATLGAVAIEKHLTNDTSREGPDHRFSATPDILGEISQGVLEVRALLGDGVKETAAIETENKKLGRRSAFALRDLPPGHVITRDDFRFVRPGAGIPPNDSRAIVGQSLVKPVKAGHPISYEDVRDE
jgi:Sialic acid synthase